MDERRKQRAGRKEIRQKPKKCGSLCCSCRLSISSSDDNEEEERVEEVELLSRLTHAMVQERLDYQIGRGRKKKQRMVEECKCIVMIAMDKESYEPREDFRRSMMEVIASNRMEEAKELRCLLNCYMSINSEECRPTILEAFHDVCTAIFMPCKH